jgi:hypothetical protein
MMAQMIGKEGKAWTLSKHISAVFERFALSAQILMQLATVGFWLRSTPDALHLLDDLDNRTFLRFY